jgi:hypothetical protein
MKRSRKSKSSNKARIPKRLMDQPAAENQHIRPHSFLTIAEGLLNGFASPFIFLLGSDLSLAKRPVSGVAEAWQDVGYHFRESAIRYRQQKGLEDQSAIARR